MVAHDRGGRPPRAERAVVLQLDVRLDDRTRRSPFAARPESAVRPHKHEQKRDAHRDSGGDSKQPASARTIACGDKPGKCDVAPLLRRFLRGPGRVLWILGLRSGHPMRAALAIRHFRRLPRFRRRPRN